MTTLIWQHRSIFFQNKDSWRFSQEYENIVIGQPWSVLFDNMDSSRLSEYLHTMMGQPRALRNTVSAMLETSQDYQCRRRLLAFRRHCVESIYQCTVASAGWPQSVQEQRWSRWKVGRQSHSRYWRHYNSIRYHWPRIRHSWRRRRHGWHGEAAVSPDRSKW